MQNLSLVNFMHDITFGYGQISMLVSHQAIFLHYYNNKIPMLCTDNSGRTLENGIYINKVLEEKHNDCSVLMPLMVGVGKQYQQNFGMNSLHIVHREHDCQHLYSLFFDLPETEFLHWTINNGNLIHDLIDNYNAAANDVILEAKSPENRITLPNYHPTKPSTNEINTTPIQQCIIHNTLNVPVYLSTQQNRCLRLLMQGKSTREIASDMKLSNRTVEGYFETIRAILGCSTNKKLIVSYLGQLT